jgi:16S rRNA (guanine966-N2)-methyltransferase
VLYGGVRIISGTAGGRRLKAPAGDATRPTSDRVREALFSILCARGPVPESVLDLYAGSGALGLEALSRGCQRATFVEEHAPTAKLIRENARQLGFDAASQIISSRVRDFLRKPPGTRFGWIFLDPPYAATQELDAALDAVGALLEAGGVAIAEHDSKGNPRDAHGVLALSDRRRYGQTALSFYEAS